MSLVLIFHAGVPWMRAGYLGVSVFFTLSGYLITSLLLAEAGRTGTVSMRTFYGRRVRRLLPASLMCIVGVMVARALGAFSRVAHLRGDIVAAQFQVFNWARLAGSTSYADLFAGRAAGLTSPLEHYWSLAIEEQFYWLWPVALLVIVRWATRRGRTVVAPLAWATLLFALAAPAVAVVFGPDAAYWATPARLAELLVGATLGAVLHRSPEVPRAARHAAAPALAAIVALSALLPSGRGLAYHGALPLFSLVGAALIWSLQTPGPVRTALSWRPLVLLGRASYGVYLFHWPIDVVLRERGWNLSTPGGFAMATALTLAVSAVSFRLIERPVRSATWSGGRSLIAAGAATACLVPFAVAMPGATPFISVDHGLLTAASIVPVANADLTPLRHSTGGAGPAAAIESGAVVPSTTSLPPVPPRPVRVLVVGDSTALFVGQGLAEWSVAHPDTMQADVEWRAGATLMFDSTNTSFDAAKEFRDSRRLFGTDVPSAVSRLHPDLVVVMVTINDVVDRRWTRAEGPLTPFDPRYRARLTEAYRAFTAALLEHGAGRVLWLVPPTPVHRFPQPEMNDPSRYAVQHEVIRDVVHGFASGDRGDAVGVIDVDGWLTAHGHAADPVWRPDGVHLTTDSAHRLADDFLGPVLLSLALGANGP